MTDRTHKHRISDLESDLEQKKSENAKNSAKSRKLKNELKRQTDSIASSKSQVLLKTNRIASLAFHLTSYCIMPIRIIDFDSFLENKVAFVRIFSVLLYSGV